MLACWGHTPATIIAVAYLLQYCSAVASAHLIAVFLVVCNDIAPAPVLALLAVSRFFSLWQLQLLLQIESLLPLQRLLL